jgi:Phage minor capsid protein 2
MPTENEPLFEDRDLTLSIVQRTVALIMEQVLTFDDILNDDKKNRLFEAVALLLQQLEIDMNEVFPAEIVDAYSAGFDLGGELLEEAGAEKITGNLQTRVHSAAVQSVAVAGVSDMQAAIRTAGAMFITDIQEILENVQSEIGSGILQGDATREITKRVQRHFAQSGLTAFTTIDGRRLPLDFYAMTVTRTKVRDAHTQGAANRYKENGYDLVRFPIRSHTCHICGARERLVVSLSGETAGYPTADEIGGLPPFHPNCRHYPIPVTDPSAYPPKPFTGRDMRTAASKENYNNEQAIRRRANEEKKQYLKMKAEAEANGENFPSIGVWRRMKRKNDEKWKALQQAYRQSVNSLPTT